MDEDRKLELRTKEQERINEEVRFVSGSAHPRLMWDIATELGRNVWAQAELDRHPDGEVKIKIEETIREKKVWVAQPICNSPKGLLSEKETVNDNLVETLALIDAAKRASGKEVSVFMPYYGYARQDRKQTGRVPISAKLVADFIETAGADRVLTYDLHAGQIQGFFDIPVDNVNIYDLEARWIVNHYPLDKVTIVAPDAGAAKKARKVIEVIQNYTRERRDFSGDVTFAVIDKERKSESSVADHGVLGEVREICIMIDDIISTFGSMFTGGFTLKDNGAEEVHAFATHGVFAGDAWKKISWRHSPIDTVATTDSIPLGSSYKYLPPRARNKIKRVSIAEHAIEVIKRTILGRSVSEVFYHN